VATTPEQPIPSNSHSPKGDSAFPVVGIGASAGGLEAFTQLLGALAVETGMAFVLIQHLNPEQPSLLSEILSRATSMVVIEVQNGMAVEPNCVYVIPPNCKMQIQNGVLALSPRPKSGQFLPINAFFYSLAEDLGSMAIGVVLSGTDGDGALGLKAIKAAGGLAFAQDEASSQFVGMPRTAAATGLIDFILPPQAIAAELARIVRHPYLRPAVVQDEIPESEEARLAVVSMLYAATGVDFSQYKRPSFRRRLQRRLALLQLETVQEYVSHLESHPEEVIALYQDVLISVTSFFRDPEVFEIVKSMVLPAIAADKTLTFPIRVWVPGCATGEEVYSLAICLLEYLKEQSLRATVQIFGTDISEEAIGLARIGLYHPTQVEAASQERLQRFFTPSDGGFQINKEVREMCVFARHNLLSDPPFSQMDLVSCRNVLIYFAPLAQKRILTTFHYSLKSSGYLLLGTSETPAGATDLFNLVDTKTKLYTRKLVPARLPMNFAAGSMIANANFLKRLSDIDVTNDLDLEKEADRIVLTRYAPAGVVINSDGDVLHFRGQTGSYLEPGPGRASLNLLKIVHPALRAELRSAFQQAKKMSVSQCRADLKLNEADQDRRVRIDIAPFKPASGETYFLVLFTETPLPTLPIGKVDSAKKRNLEQQRIVELQQELVAKEEYLRTAIEELETVNQNLRVANEEILSSNEELQSTNEELQTAKEEIQATNEELHTINEELQRRNLSLDQLGNDLQNLLASTQIPIVMLDGALRIRRFTPLAGQLLNLIPTDVGRPIGNINLQLSVSDLSKRIQEVIGTLNTYSEEVQDRDGCWYELRIRPYRTLDNKIEGAAVVLVDIDESKRAAETIKASRDYAQSIVETVRVPLMVFDADLRIVTANRAFYELFQTTPIETEGQPFFALSHSQWNLPPLRLHLKNVLLNHTQLLDYEVQQQFEKIGEKNLRLNGSEVIGYEQGRLILLSLEDITEQSRAAELQRSALQKEYELNELKSRLIAIASHEFRTPLSTIILSSQLLVSNDPNQSVDKRLAHQQRIEKAIVQITNLLDGILNIGRAETEQIQIQRSAIELKSFCQQLIEELQNTTHRLVLIENIQQGQFAYLDANMLKQILTNLIANALKYSAIDRTVRLEVACQETEAIFKIVDQGIGISPEDLEQLFEPFYRGRNVGSVSGSGLGLAIVKRLVETLKGQISFESQLDYGTTFTVTLPLQEPING
jgi:two-component system, chemotaxis family, CheB/CheR fusion protein